MRLLVLALFLLFHQDPSPEWRRTLTLVNRSDEIIPRGIQVAVDLFKGPNAPKTSEARVFHNGKLIPTCYTGAKGRWFKLPADLPARARDAGYEIRYGQHKVSREFSDVFDFYEDFSESDLDPDRWDMDRGVVFKRSRAGLAVTHLPGNRNEYAPASLVPRMASIPPGFVFTMSVEWKLISGSSVSVALVAELDSKIVPTKEDRERVAALIRDLADDGIEVRDRALKQLVAIGPVALPSLEEAARSSDAEVRARTVAVIDAICRDHPPPAISTGVRAESHDEKDLNRVTYLGKSRTSNRIQNGLVGDATFTIERDAKGMTFVAWGPGKGVAVPVPGTVSRFRLDFWAPRAGEIGEFRIGRVMLRRFVDEMPLAEFGPEEPVR